MQNDGMHHCTQVALDHCTQVALHHCTQVALQHCTQVALHHCTQVALHHLRGCVCADLGGGGGACADLRGCVCADLGGGGERVQTSEGGRVQTSEGGRVQTSVVQLYSCFGYLINGSLACGLPLSLRMLRNIDVYLNFIGTNDPYYWKCLSPQLAVSPEGHTSSKHQDRFSAGQPDHTVVCEPQSLHCMGHANFTVTVEPLYSGHRWDPTGCPV